MKCERAEELFTDDIDGSLTPAVERELRDHLDTCVECRALHVAFQDVVTGLGTYPVPAPPETVLPRLVAIAAPSKLRRQIPLAEPRPRTLAALGWLAVAAVLALMVFGRPPELVSELSRTTSRAAHDIYSYGVRTFHRTERWIEDLNVLRLTVEVAFEERLDRINERLRDLQRAGRGSDDDEGQSRDERPGRLADACERAGLVAFEPPPRSLL